MDVLGGWLNEIRFFYKRQVFHPLSPHGQALWHYLMWRANEVFWQLPLRLSVPEIAGATHMSAAMVKKARTELEASGYILTETYGGSRPAGYVLLSCITPGKPLEIKPKIAEKTTQ
jgi:hypothetical protein